MWYRRMHGTITSTSTSISTSTSTLPSKLIPINNYSQKNTTIRNLKRFPLSNLIIATTKRLTREVIANYSTSTTSARTITHSAASLGAALSNQKTFCKLV
mmetsp:Transcript_12352/g.17604  ORF Transcript_12352/g.17604 Transcript_12352/m.17604 type:complete len:100 (-) Transcript_12352:581-880(-)